MNDSAMNGKTDWIDLKEEVQLNDITRESEYIPVIIYKHSTRCGLSFSAEMKLKRGWDLLKSRARFYYLDLIQYRSLSTMVAERFRVSHESPQVLIIKNGRSVFDISHHLIDVDEIIQYL